MEANGTISGGSPFNWKMIAAVVVCVLLVMWSKLFAFLLVYLLVGYGLILKRDGKAVADDMGISLLWWPKIYFNNE